MNWIHFGIAIWGLGVLSGIRFSYNSQMANSRRRDWSLFVFAAMFSIFTGPFMALALLLAEGKDCFSDRGPIKWNFKRIKFRIKTV